MLRYSDAYLGHPASMFDVRDGGWMGWAGVLAGVAVAAVLAWRRPLHAGAPIGERGENISAQYEKKYVPKPDLGVLFSQLEKSSSIAEGAVAGAKATVYGFVDANCPYSHFAGSGRQGGGISRPG